MIRDDTRREEAGELETAVAVRRAHHGDLDALIAQPGHMSCPFSFDRGPPFELGAELSKEIYCPPRSATTIPTLSIRLSAMCGVYKVSSSSNNGPFFQGQSTNRAEPARSLPNSAYSGEDHVQSGVIAGLVRETGMSPGIVLDVRVIAYSLIDSGSVLTSRLLVSERTA